MTLQTRPYVEVVVTLAMLVLIFLMSVHPIVAKQLQQMPPDANLGAPVFTLVEIGSLAALAVLVLLVGWAAKYAPRGFR
jgi:uncharacterized BrkB/YihY/UPF0761 family membrane protein